MAFSTVYWRTSMDLNPCSILHPLFAALRAGESILSVYDDDFEIGYKDDKSPLTLADRNSHRIIAETLSAGTPELLSILSEEGKAIPYGERRNWQRFWLVDPLDGTKEFIKRNGEFTVNIALVDGNQPVIGVIYAPVNDVIYFAEKGLGAYKMKGANLYEILHPFVSGSDHTMNDMNNKTRDKLLDMIFPQAVRLPGRCTGGHTKTSIRIAGSRSHGDGRFSDFVEFLNSRYDCVERLSVGSSLKFCLVAEGRVDLYPRFGPTMEWDTGAGDIMVKEAGGRVINLETGGELIYNKQELLNPSFMAMSNSQVIIQ